MFWLKLYKYHWIWVFFTHLKLWVAVAKHNFKWVKFEFYNVALNTYSAMINSRRQNLTSVGVRFWRLKSIPALKEYKYL